MARREKRDVVLLSSWLAFDDTPGRLKKTARHLATVVTLRLLRLVLGQPLPLTPAHHPAGRCGTEPSISPSSMRLPLSLICVSFRATWKLIRRNCSERDLRFDTYWCSYPLGGSAKCTEQSQDSPSTQEEIG